MIHRVQDMLSSFQRYQHLLVNLVQRDLKVKYRRSALGFLWSVLSPVMMMLIMTAVFSYVFRFEIENFPVYLLSAQLVFNFFSSATSSAMGAVLGYSTLIKKVYIPKYIFPFEKVVYEFINALFTMVALLVVMLATGVPITAWFFLFPVPLLLLFVFNLGVGLFLSAVMVFFRDIQHLYSVLIVALNYLTPIFYPMEILPAPMQVIIRFNPLFWYVTMFRYLVLYGIAPTPTMWICTIASSIFAMVFGLLFFKSKQDRFILHI